jgi:KaiC/GvpD/RAD55 family RecA-like ATPase
MIDKTLVLVTREESYLNKIFELIKEHGKKVCYVTFNKTPDFILESAEEYNIPRDKFYFIDCITARIKSSAKIKNSVQISDFDNLAKISKNIKEIVGQGYPLVIFDSLSNILIYPSMKDSIIVKFINVLSESLDKMNGEIVFVCYENDIENYSLDKAVFLFNKFITPPHELFRT